MTFTEKETYKMLNDINIDEDEYADIDINMSELQKKNLKKSLKNQIYHKNIPSKIKYGFEAAAVVTACIVGVSLAAPALAQNIPVLNSIIQKLNYAVGDYGDYAKYSQAVGLSAKDKGLTVIINEVACDENTLIIGYTIKGDKKIKDILPNNQITVPHIMTRIFKVNSKDLNLGSGGRGHYTDDYTYIGTEELNIANQKIPENFKFDMMIKNIGELEGNWNFKFMISREATAKQTIVFKPNKKVDFPDAQVNINKVSFSPIDIAITMEGKLNKNYSGKSKEIMEYNWFVFDDKGTQLSPKSSSGGTTNSYDFSCELHFVKLDRIPEYLTVIPYEMPWDKIEQGNYKAKQDIKPIGSYPIELSQGKIGKLIITNIEFLADRTTIHYTAHGLAPFTQAGTLGLMDENGKPIFSENRANILKDTKNPNEYTMDFGALDKNKKYKVSAINFDDYDINEEPKFTIPLNK